MDCAARSICESLGSGYSVERTQGKFGEDAHVVHISSDGTKSFMQTFTATKENQRSAISNFDTWLSNEAGRADAANNGTTTTADVRAVAGYCENLSDASDVAAVGSTLSGVGIGAAPILYTIGRVAGTASDLINIGVELYEGRKGNALIRVAGATAGFLLQASLETKLKSVNNLSGAALDKVLDKSVEVVIDYNETKRK